MERYLGVALCFAAGWFVIGYLIASKEVTLTTILKTIASFFGIFVGMLGLRKVSRSRSCELKKALSECPLPLVLGLKVRKDPLRNFSGTGEINSNESSFLSDLTKDCDPNVLALNCSLGEKKERRE